MSGSAQAWDLTTYAEPGVSIGIAGNKADKPKDPGLDLDLVRKSCIDWGASLHFTSAITGEGVDDLFLDLQMVEMLVKAFDRH